jgi:phosphoglycolate phosphatase
MVKKFFPDFSFQAVKGQRAGFPKKPDPAGAVEIAAELGLPAESFIYLGDTDTDMQTAVKAGMFPAGVLWGFRGRKELIENGAKVLLENPINLIELL